MKTLKRAHIHKKKKKLYKNKLQSIPHLRTFPILSYNGRFHQHLCKAEGHLRAPALTGMGLNIGLLTGLHASPTHSLSCQALVLRHQWTTSLIDLKPHDNPSRGPQAAVRPVQSWCPHVHCTPLLLASTDLPLLGPSSQVAIHPIVGILGEPPPAHSTPGQTLPFILTAPSPGSRASAFKLAGCPLST